jgi:hypothetical protein
MNGEGVGGAAPLSLRLNSIWATDEWFPKRIYEIK